MHFNIATGEIVNLASSNLEQYDALQPRPHSQLTCWAWQTWQLLVICFPSFAGTQRSAHSSTNPFYMEERQTKTSNKPHHKSWLFHCCVPGCAYSHQHLEPGQQPTTLFRSQMQKLGARMALMHRSAAHNEIGWKEQSDECEADPWKNGSLSSVQWILDSTVWCTISPRNQINL